MTRLYRCERCGQECFVSNEFRSLKVGALSVPVEICYVEDSTRRQPNHELRLSYDNAGEVQIREGIRRFGALLQKKFNREASPFCGHPGYGSADVEPLLPRPDHY